MSVIRDGAAVFVVTVVAIVIHLFGSLVFPVLQGATVGPVGIYNGSAAQTGLNETITVWIPLLLVVGAFAIAVWRVYRRQRLVAEGRPPL